MIDRQTDYLSDGRQVDRQIDRRTDRQTNRPTDWNKIDWKARRMTYTLKINDTVSKFVSTHQLWQSPKTIKWIFVIDLMNALLTCSVLILSGHIRESSKGVFRRI